MATQEQFKQSSELSPSQALLQMTAGYWISQAIYVAAKLGIADLLRDGPMSSEELAQATGAHPRALYRLLRALASVEVFREREDGGFELTPRAACLLSDVPGSLRAVAMVRGEPYFWEPWGRLLQSVQTGRAAFEEIYGMRFFEYLAQHPQDATTFGHALFVNVAQKHTAVAKAYDFSQFGTVVDVGGGQGALLTAMLTAHPQVRGILFDQPHVVEAAKPHITTAGLAPRCELVSGDFFASVPAGGDAYTLSEILHDWDDPQATVILRNIRKAMPQHGKVLILEQIIPPGNDPYEGKLRDLHMLVILGGVERTESEFHVLLREAGFRLTGITQTASPTRVIEGVCS
jgi:O-methyltransferase/methyltransferase family protein